jgi:hypothetical protein
MRNTAPVQTQPGLMQKLSLPLISCVTSGQVLYCSVLQFTHLQSGTQDGAWHTVLWSRFNERPVKYLAQPLVHRKWAMCRTVMLFTLLCCIMCNAHGLWRPHRAVLGFCSDHIYGFRVLMWEPWCREHFGLRPEHGWRASEPGSPYPSLKGVVSVPAGRCPSFHAEAGIVAFTELVQALLAVSLSSSSGRQLWTTPPWGTGQGAREEIKTPFKTLGIVTT